MDILAPLEALAADLNTAGVPASTDTARINPPAAWVHATDVQIDRLDGNATVSAVVDLVVPDQSTAGAITALQSLLTKTLTVLDPDGPIELDRAVELRSGAQLPSFRVPVNLDLH